jgi:hypothetical protein
VYYENNSKKFQVLNDAGAPQVVKDGMVLVPGWILKTFKGDNAEVKLMHNGTIVRIAANTTFTVKALGTTKDAPNVLSVTAGKIRTVAGKATGDERYQIQGGAAVCGVRGTDFIFEVTDYDEFLNVLDGLVDFWKNTSPDKIIQVGKGMMTSFKSFSVAEMTVDIIDDIGEQHVQELIPPRCATGLRACREEKIERAKSDIVDRSGRSRCRGQRIVIDGTTGRRSWRSWVQARRRQGRAVPPLIYDGNMFDPEDWYPERQRRVELRHRPDGCRGRGGRRRVRYGLKIKYLSCATAQPAVLQNRQPRRHHRRSRPDHAGLRE